MKQTICERVEASLRRTLDSDFPLNFQCVENDDGVVISGTVVSRNDAALCRAIAHCVPNAGGVKCDFEVSSDRKTEQNGMDIA